MNSYRIIVLTPYINPTCIDSKSKKQEECSPKGHLTGNGTCTFKNFLRYQSTVTHIFSPQRNCHSFISKFERS